MLAGLIIVFREAFEAGLIIGIVMAVTGGVPRRGYWIIGGVAVGVLGACIVATFAGALSSAFSGVGQELFNASILSVAVIMLCWHNVWMARHGRELAAEMRQAGQAVIDGSKSLASLAVVVGVAVLREGFEVVLFLYGVVASDAGSGWQVLGGGIIGLVLASLTCVLTYLGLVTIPSRYLFSVTSVMIIFLAAGMAAQATAFLERANAVTALGGVVWDSSWLLSDSSLVGRALHTLIGYSDQPTQMQLLVYLATVVVIWGLMRQLSSPRIGQAQATS